VEYAVRVAAEAGARRLALFHHDPAHDDAAIDRILGDARRYAEGTSLREVVAAAEGLTVSLSLAPAGR
jgi:ribonuclease BN (tRNA processing enzyme)